MLTNASTFLCSQWGRYDLRQNTTLAAAYYNRVARATGNPFAQYMLGFLHSTNFGSAMDSSRQEGDGDQGAAVLHYTFSALAGQQESELAMGYRHWVGIGVKQSCPDALPWYKSAADRAIRAFESGPKVRLADVKGGAYGPGASTTTAQNQQGHSSHNSLPKTEREWDDLLEYYLFHADRGDAAFMFRIGRIYYQGFNPIGPNGGFGGSETGGRDFARALRWFMRIARGVWPRDPIAAYTNTAQLNASPGRTGQGGNSGPHRQVSHSSFYDESKDVKLKVEDSKSMAAGLAAGYLGRMFLRGEGFPEQDYQKAFLWFQRGVSHGDRESHNGLGIMYRDGLGVAEDQVKALSHFQTAAAADHPDALVNVARYHLGP
jgi:SEL1 protein